MNLAQLSIGNRGEVVHVEGVDEISLRLMEMGLVPGTAFTLLGAAPLGDPLEACTERLRDHLRRSYRSLNHQLTPMISYTVLLILPRGSDVTVISVGGRLSLVSWDELDR